MRLSTIFTIAALPLITVSCKPKATSTEAAKEAVENAQPPTGTTITIPGTFPWKVGEQIGEASLAGSDFLWEIHNSTKRSLALQNGTRAAVIDTPFDSVDSKLAGATDLTPDPIDGQHLRPGRVVVFKTAAGRLGKFVVVDNSQNRENNLQVRWQFL